MRISDLSRATGIPLATLKDLRHRKILELAVRNQLKEDAETRQWGDFSLPAAIIIYAAKELRDTYSMSWDTAIDFAKKALSQVRETVDGSPASAKFFDLGAVEKEIWVGRFVYPELLREPSAPWGYFACELADLEDCRRHWDSFLTDAMIAENLEFKDAAAEIEPKTCLLVNASKIVAAFKLRAKEVGAL